MSTMNRVREFCCRSVRDLHRDEEGLNTIEMVLIVCCAALMIYGCYKYLWVGTKGGDEPTGIIASLFGGVVTKFRSIIEVNIGS
jgi:Flp pilus assembly pilin Flp